MCVCVCVSVCVCVRRRGKTRRIFGNHNKQMHFATVENGRMPWNCWWIVNGTIKQGNYYGRKQRKAPSKKRGAEMRPLVVWPKCANDPTVFGSSLLASGEQTIPAFPTNRIHCVVKDWHSIFGSRSVVLHLLRQFSCCFSRLLPFLFHRPLL